ncbi:hypothetical protein GJ496_011570, partial [Pomphorhynchus laevis]
MFLYQVISCSGRADDSEFQTVRFCHQKTITERPLFVNEKNIILKSKMIGRNFRYRTNLDAISKPVVFNPMEIKSVTLTLKLPLNFRNFTVKWSIAELWKIEGSHSFRPISTIRNKYELSIVLTAKDLYRYKDVVIAVRISSDFTSDFDYVKFAHIRYTRDPVALRCVETSCLQLRNSFLLFGFPSTPMLAECLNVGDNNSSITNPVFTLEENESSPKLRISVQNVSSSAILDSVSDIQ